MNFNKKTIIITGAYGFIGSHLAHKLFNEIDIDDVQILCCDRCNDLKNISKETIQDSSFEHLSKEAYVSPDALLRAILLTTREEANNILAVVHLGAEADTFNEGQDMIDNNVSYSIALFNACAQANIKFIFASSSAVYGNKLIVEPGVAYRPLNMYGRTKQAVEDYIRNSKLFTSDNKTYDRWNILRFHNIYGLNELHKVHMMSMVTKIALKHISNSSVKLFEDKDRSFSRDYVPVNMVSSLIKNLILTELPYQFRTIDVGTGVSFSCHQIHELFSQMTGIVEDIHNVDLVEFKMPERVAKVFQVKTLADPLKIHRLLTDRAYLEDNKSTLACSANISFDVYEELQHPLIDMARHYKELYNQINLYDSLGVAVAQLNQKI